MRRFRWLCILDQGLQRLGYSNVCAGEVLPNDKNGTCRTQPVCVSYTMADSTFALAQFQTECRVKFFSDEADGYIVNVFSE